MKISDHWLRDLLHIDLDAAAIAERLTSAGLEVDEVHPLAGTIDHLLVGEIIDLVAHSNADRLRVATVNIGESHLSIVCGAANAAVGMKVAVALVGAVLPNGLKIKKSKLRGQLSEGMLCSAAELGLEEQSSGILDLGDDAEIGASVDQLLDLHDHVIDIDLTPNRGDCLSVRGIARELTVLTDAQPNFRQFEAVVAAQDASVDVRIEDIDACPSYCARRISGLNEMAKTPLWMAERLRRCGVRPIRAVVDITNYVMLELGQPMHAFDGTRLQGEIVVRRSTAGESLLLLDGSQADLLSDTLVITDDSGPIAIAGVMGGELSAIDDQTSEIVFEAAHFTPKAVAGCARNYGLHTESSHRFERGVDPLLPVTAIEYATQLVLDICGGQAAQLIQTGRSEELLRNNKTVEIRAERVNRVIGDTIAKQEMQKILAPIAASLEETNQGWRFLAPSYRFDIEYEADLIEEIARVRGYDKIPNKLPGIAPRATTASEKSLEVDQIRHFMAARDFQEVINYSFCDRQELQEFSQEKPICLLNPIADNMAVMRTTLMAGLMKSMQYNLHRQKERLRLFEIGSSYHQIEDKVVEVPQLAGMICGNNLAQSPHEESKRDVDYFDVKGVIEALLSLTNNKKPIIFKEFDHIFAHPGQISLISRPKNKSSASEEKSEQNVIGWMGRMHPSLQKKFDFPTAVYMFELNLEEVQRTSIPLYRGISRFPSIRRDLSVVVKGSTAATDVLNAVEDSIGDLSQQVELFDVFHDDSIGEDYKSLSLSFIMQHSDRTMTDAEAAETVERVLRRLASDFDAKLRQ